MRTIAILLLTAGLNVSAWADFNVVTNPLSVWRSKDVFNLQASATNYIIDASGSNGASIVHEVLVMTRVETNVVTSTDASGCFLCTASGTIPAVYYVGGGGGSCKPYHRPTQKTETTTVIEIKTLRFVWEGKEEVIERRRELSRTVRTWKMKETWAEEGTEEAGKGN